MSEIKPALSKQEWANHRTIEYFDDGGFPLILSLDSPHFVEVGDDTRTIRVSGPRLHALAALCLHGQPFGFGGADVELLRRVAHHLDGAPGWFPGEAAEMRRIAAKIEALLPPQEKP